MSDVVTCIQSYPRRASFQAQTEGPEPRLTHFDEDGKHPGSARLGSHDKTVTRASCCRHAGLVNCAPPGAIPADERGHVVLDLFSRFHLSLRHLRHWPVIIMLGLVAGCARFHSQPLSPAETATTLESRSLDNPDLKAFLEKNLHRELNPWPARKWDFEMLTLAAFYYHPSLEVARADWRVAAGGVETAAERPNPTVTESLAYEPAPDAFSPWIPGMVFDLPLETAGKRRFRTEQARHLSESARLKIATTAWQVRSQLRAALLDFSSARQRVALLERQAALRKDLVSRIPG